MWVEGHGPLLYPVRESIQVQPHLIHNILRVSLSRSFKHFIGSVGKDIVIIIQCRFLSGFYNYDDLL